MGKKYTTIKSLIVLACTLAFNAGAQLTGVYTINSAVITGGTNYQSFNDFATDINTNGVSGPVTVNVAPGSGPYIEQPQFMVIAGTSATNKIVINGNGNVLTFNSTSFTQPWTLGLNGTDYMTVNDLNLVGQGTTYALVCRLSNAADNNTFNNCTFTAPQNGTGTNQVPFSIGSNMTNGVSGGSNSGNGNSVVSCTMSNGYYGAVLYGLTGSPYNVNNSLIDCYITDFYAYGVYFSYQKEVTIKNCTLDRLTRTSNTTTYGLAGWFCQGAMIDGNKIHKLFESNQGTTSACYAMYTYYTSLSGLSGGLRQTVRNNIITDIKSNGTIYGMYCYYMNADIFNNTLDLDWQTGTSNGTIWGMYPYGAAGYNQDIRNNIITIRRGGSGTRVGIYVAIVGNIVIENNNIFVNSTTGNNNIGYANGNIATLTAWQTAGYDLAGFSVDPMYNNQAAGDLHPTDVTINNMAQPIAGLFFDQKKAVRNATTPDIGALEFLTPVCSGAPGVNSLASPNFAICPGENVNLSLTNLVADAGITYQWQSSQISNVGPFTNIPGQTGLFYTAPTVTANTWFSVVMTCTAPGGGTSSYVGAVQVAGPTASTVPAYDDFEGIGLSGRLPNCSWSSNSLGGACQTYVTSGTGNRVPRSGTSFGTFNNNTPGTNYYYTNPIQMEPTITYSAAIHYATEYFGYGNWTNLSILVGPNQSTVGMVQVASVSPALSGPYKLLDGLFTVPSSGQYYVAIRATSTAGSAQYLMIDDLSVTIPCGVGSPNASTVTTNVSGSSTVCAGDQVGVNAIGADTYTWSTGANGPSITFVPTTQNNVLSVTGTNTLTGCTSMTTEVFVVNPSPNVFIVASSPVVCAGKPSVLTAFGASQFAWSGGSTSMSITVNPTVTTTYNVIGINSFGCSAPAMVNVAVNPLPVISALSSNPGEACKDDLLSLSASGAVSYVWNNNVTNQVFAGSNINVLSPATVVYTITGKDANGCEGTTTLVQSISECTGIEKNGGLNSLSVFPNPTSGLLNIVFASASDKSLQLMDVTGRVVMTQNVTDTNAQLDISTLSNGIYHLRISSNEGSTVLKVVKE